MPSSLIPFGLGQVAPELVWGLFTRGLGVVFLISFASLSVQIVLGAGRDGGLPISMRLARIKKDFPSFRRFFYFPTLLWVNDSDAMLQALPIVGLGAAGVIVYGGPLTPWAFLTCYLSYLSLDMAIGLIFPWDCLLFESSILAILLPPTHSLPDLTAVAAPVPALAWAYRIALFRVMFGFGKQKFLGSTAKDLAYMKGFLISQPLPSKIAWYVQKLPAVLLKPLVLFMFFVEIPAPCFVFIPGILSVVCAASVIFLMIGIQAMGSFGYFSMLTMVACIPLFDNVTPTELHPLTQLSSAVPLSVSLTTAFVIVHTLSACVAFVFNSWVGQSWHLWSLWYRLPRVFQLPFDFFRLMHPFRWLHPFGVFPPNLSPGVKITLVPEVTWDEVTWHELLLHYSPTHPSSPPRFIAPHHPRGDQAVIYETFGLNPTSLISSMVGPWDPYSYGARPGADVMLERILEGHGLRYLKSKALEEHNKPPLAARLSTVMLEPLSIKEHSDTGNWWKRTYVGPHAPPRRVDPHFWDDFLPEPELWHFDAIFWRRRSRLKPMMDRAVTGNEDPMTLVLDDPDGLTAKDVERFWNELIPLVSPEERESLDTLADVVPRVRERFDRRDLRAMQRLLGRFSAILVAKLEPMYLGRGGSPEIPAKTYFHLWMVTQHIIGNGRDAYLAAVRDPRSVTPFLSVMTPHTGLYLLSIFRFESMTFDAQKLRLITSFTAPHDEAAKAAVAHSLEAFSPLERKMAELAQSASGYVCIMPFIRDSFKGPRFDRGYPELYPTFRQLDSGEVVLRDYRTPPPGIELPGAG